MHKKVINLNLLEVFGNTGVKKGEKLQPLFLKFLHFGNFLPSEMILLCNRMAF